MVFVCFSRIGTLTVYVLSVMVSLGFNTDDVVTARFEGVLRRLMNADTAASSKIPMAAREAT
jgi:hypothetical protein